MGRKPWYDRGIWQFAISAFALGLVGIIMVAPPVVTIAIVIGVAIGVLALLWTIRRRGEPVRLGSGGGLESSGPSQSSTSTDSGGTVS